MIKINLILLGAILLYSVSYGQDNSLIHPKNADKSYKSNSSYVSQKLSKKKSSDFIEINLNKLKNYNTLSMQFDEKNYTVGKEQIKIRGVNNFSWFAKNHSDDGNIILSVLNNDIQGLITKGNELYRISTASSGEYILTKIDQSIYPEDMSPIVAQERINRSNSVQEDDFNDKAIEKNSNAAVLKSTAVHDCKVRVLVTYTPAAKKAVSNIRNTIQLAVDETNQSFINSKINYEIELVYVEGVNYTEVDAHTDLERFVRDDDGFMDEVHDLRDTYSADICVIINDDDGVCGTAYVEPGERYAYCLVNYDCATGYYSFAHEIGHIIGCHHDTYVESPEDLEKPIKYRHGFVNAEDKWRTIMSYNTECKDKGFNCTKLQYWSNPDIIYNGDAMGSVEWENCTRFWNEYAPNVMTFRQPETNVILTGDDLSNSLYADVIAIKKNSTSGNITVSNGSALILRAGNEIALKPGFSAEFNSEFSARTETVSDCGTSTKSAKITFEKDNKTTDEIEEMNENISYNIYPNPSFEKVNISYKLDATSTVTITLIDFLGANVKHVCENKNQDSGNHNIQFNISDISAGIYFIRIMINDKSITEKIIIK